MNAVVELEDIKKQTELIEMIGYLNKAIEHLNDGQTHYTQLKGYRFKSKKHAIHIMSDAIGFNLKALTKSTEKKQNEILYKELTV